MDNAKDISKKDSLIRYVSNQTTRTNPFGENVSAERVYRRAERIVTALHLLTNHLPENDQLRAEVRRTALVLLTASLGLRDELRTRDSRHMHDAYTSIRLLISLVRMLGVSGHISFQNADIACEALDELGAFLKSAERTPLSENVRLTREDFFDVRIASHVPERHVVVQKDIERASAANAQKDTKTNVVLYGAEGESLDAREASIVEILRAGGEWGIRDIAAHLPEYSEKMIQRELADLVSAGRVKKTGAKRWSRYALAVPEAK